MKRPCTRSTPQHFNPRSPDGERPSWRTLICGCFRDFNPRSPDGERLRADESPIITRQISIHAPRMGSDLAHGFVGSPRDRISIHAPRMGSDLTSITPCGATNQFQSTLPGWGATQGRGRPLQEISISIHAPRMGSDIHLTATSLMVM